MSFLNPMLLCDFYKLSHRLMYPEKTQFVYSTWTPRASRIAGVDHVVAFGFQAFIKKYLINFFNENFFARDVDEVAREYKTFVSATLGPSARDDRHIRALHKLGYLPLQIKALPEGTLTPLRVPMLSIQNTHPDFFWLTNYIESLASAELWQACTSATIAYRFRKMLDKKAKQSNATEWQVAYQGHDFSMRGMSSLESAINSGMGHLLSFFGTDTIPAIQALQHYYGADFKEGMIGTSIPASEHSIQCAYGDDLAYIKRLITEVHPSGLVSIVADGYDFWNVIDVIIPKIKHEILGRDGTVVLRPDSGDPYEILCGALKFSTGREEGAVESLWRIFGKQYNGMRKVLPRQISLIYGDAISFDVASRVTDWLVENDYESTAVVFGIGSFTYQYNTRDTFGFALKSSAAIIDGVEKQIFKDPKTDDGTKRSLIGRVAVVPHKNTLKAIDGLGLNDQITADQLITIFEDGKAHNNQTLTEIRNRLHKGSTWNK